MCYISYLLCVFQARWKSPALSYPLGFRRGTHVLLPDSKPALSQRVLPDPALQRQPAALPRLWTAPHWRRAAARPTSTRRVRHIWTNMSLTHHRGLDTHDKNHYAMWASDKHLGKTHFFSHLNKMIYQKWFYDNINQSLCVSRYCRLQMSLEQTWKLLPCMIK